MKKRTIPFLFIIYLLMVGLFPPYSYGEEEKKIKLGFSISAGTGEVIHKTPDTTKYVFLPRLSIPLNRNWDLELEGNYSYWAIVHKPNLYFLGGDTNILFKPIQWKKGALFFLVGGGLGYDNSGGKVKWIGDSHFASILQGGAGVLYKVGKSWAIRGEYRFNHVSEPFEKDRGINTHDFLLGLSL
jgi:hypothetical protein